MLWSTFRVVRYFQHLSRCLAVALVAHLEGFLAYVQGFTARVGIAEASLLA